MVVHVKGHWRHCKSGKVIWINDYSYERKEKKTMDEHNENCTCDCGCGHGGKPVDEETKKKVLDYQKKHKEVYGNAGQGTQTHKVTVGK